MRLRKALLAGTILAGLAAADAQPVTGFYRPTGTGVDWGNSPEEWAQYNRHLLQHPADAVTAELVRQGISRNEIAVTVYGERRPLVPTADGVREPQNRRVEPVLR